MQAEIISVGTELLLGQIVDTNAAYLSQILSGLGIDVFHRTTVGDNEDRIAQSVKDALSRADIAITIGGLGPTQDDLTKETVAKTLGVELLFDEEAAERISDFFAMRKLPMVESNLKQAVKPASGRTVPNPVGTAPGAIFEKDGKCVICLPGPPVELIPMVTESVVPYLKEKLGPAAMIIKSKVLRTTGIGESLMEEKVKDLLQSKNPTLAPLAKTGEAHLRITAKAADEKTAGALIDGIETKVRERLGAFIYGVDDETLEHVIIRALIVRGLTIGLAESCTGGLISDRLTDTPGSSAAFLAGVISYSNESKVELLGVSEELLKKYGAVNGPVAEAMAEGARKAARSHIGIGVTGIAGPGGGTKEKPVGLVYIALSQGKDADSEAEKTYSQEFRFSGDRRYIKQRASQAALNMLRNELL
ncbi:MAG: competence/damage-inducible protein A [Armatimonadota bacterium]|nr:competence/damage-inducible protein A [Armatimonadota bacterium]